MCRFLLAESEQPFQPQELVHKFAEMSRQSKSYDGDWQGDGGGISWFANNEWQGMTSLNPFWENADTFSQIPDTKQVVMHARSASFPDQKGILEYNQPYIAGKYAFVFNGMLKGVALPYRLDGKIGAQKIWSLVQKYLEDNSPVESLQKTVDLLNKHTREIQALNLGLADGTNIYSYTQFGSHPEYYNLRIYETPEMNIVCSEGLEGMDFVKAAQSTVLQY